MVPHAAAIQTEALEKAAERTGQPLDKFLGHMGRMHAMQRVGQAEEVAAPIVFLASDAASFITGQCLAIDGGALLGFWSNSGPFPEHSTD